MAQDRDPALDALRLREDVAQQLLARAIELDTQTGAVSVAQLRQSAVEAGVSLRAFEAALAELSLGMANADDRPALSRMPRPIEPPARPARSAARRRWMVVGACLLSFTAGAAAVSATLLRRDAPRVQSISVHGVDETVPRPAPGSPAVQVERPPVLKVR